MQERKWYGPAMRRDEECVRERVMRMDVEGRRKERPKQVNMDVREKGESGENDEIYKNATCYITTLIILKLHQDIHYHHGLRNYYSNDTYLQVNHPVDFFLARHIQVRIFRADH